MFVTLFVILLTGSMVMSAPVLNDDNNEVSHHNDKRSRDWYVVCDTPAIKNWCTTYEETECSRIGIITSDSLYCMQRCYCRHVPYVACRLDDALFWGQVDCYHVESDGKASVEDKVSDVDDKSDDATTTDTKVEITDTKVETKEDGSA